MSSAYGSIISGLTEAVEDAKAEKKTLQRRTVTIVPVKDYNASEVQDIRTRTGTNGLLVSCTESTDVVYGNKDDCL